MKGMVFTEFLDFVEAQTNYDIVDEMIERSDLPSGGVYSATGKYEFQEMASLVSNLSKIINVPVPELLQIFGKHLMGRFSQLYPEFFVAETNTLSLLEKVENYVHVEVKKLYPDAELPTLDVKRLGPDEVVVRYISCRPLGDLCIGLIEGCGEHFGEQLDMTIDKKEDGLEVLVSRQERAAA